MTGYSRNSPWPSLGVLRGVAQSVSYEVSASFILLGVFWGLCSSSLSDLGFQAAWCPLVLLNLPLALAWVVSSLAESNRTPFDFREAESELISGFNLEYGSGYFAAVFIAEYFALVTIVLVSAELLLTLEPFSLEMVLLACVLLYAFV